MRFLIDEMSGRTSSHACVPRDRDVLARAADDDSIVVTENAADFVPLLDARTAAGLPTPPVVIALKRNRPASAGAMHQALADKLTRWSKDHPRPLPARPLPGVGPAPAPRR